MGGFKLVSHDLEEKFILLEISGAQGNLEKYKHYLEEAASLNINRVLLSCIWDGQEDKGEELLNEVTEICSDLQIVPFPMTLGYKDLVYTEVMIGTVTKIDDKVTPDINSMVPLEDYKASKKITSNAKKSMDSFMEKLENGELTHVEEPENEKHTVKLDDKFIEEQVESFGQLLDSPLMRAVEQDVDNPRCLSLKDKTTSD